MKAKLTKRELEILQRLRDIELRLSVLESLPTPIVFAIGKYPDPLRSDMVSPQVPELEH